MQNRNVHTKNRGYDTISLHLIPGWFIYLYSSALLHQKLIHAHPRLGELLIAYSLRQRHDAAGPADRDDLDDVQILGISKISRAFCLLKPVIGCA